LEKFVKGDRITNMNLTVSHSRTEETLEAKTRWFRSLPLSERIEIFCFFTDLALNANPQIADLKDDQQTTGRVRVLSKAQR
jgi:hypothetical protein